MPPLCRAAPSAKRSAAALQPDARKVFDDMPHREVVAWTAILMSAHTADGDADEALELFPRRNQEGVAPNVLALAAVLNACSAGKHMEFTHQLHAQVVKLQDLRHPYVGSYLVEANTSCEES